MPATAEKRAAWLSALAAARDEEEELSPEEIEALKAARAKLRAQGVDLLTQDDIERAARELEAL